MADFCRQCALRNMFPGADLDQGYRDNKEDTLGDDEGYPELCEGCGFIIVDWAGQCIAKQCMENHYPEKVYKTYQEWQQDKELLDKPFKEMW